MADAHGLFDRLPSRAIGRRRPRRSGAITLAELEHARAMAARVVLDCGEQYLPIFERLEAEIAKFKARETLHVRLRAIVEGDDG